MGGGIPVQGNLLRNSALLDRPLQEPFRRSDIPLFTQEKVDRLPLFVDPAVEGDPFPLSFMEVSSTRHDVPTDRVKRCHRFSHAGT